MNFLLPVNPVPLARSRVTIKDGRAHTYHEPQVEAFYEEVALRARQLPFRALEGDLLVDLTFWRHCRSNADRGDLDNCVKSTLDSLQGWLYLNDSQVLALGARFAEWGPKVEGRIKIDLRPVSTIEPLPEPNVETSETKGV